MTAPSFALAIVTAILAVGLIVWALSTWGMIVIPALLCMALLAVWAFSHVGYDDGHT